MSIECDIYPSYRQLNKNGKTDGLADLNNRICLRTAIH